MFIKRRSFLFGGLFSGNESVDIDQPEGAPEDVLARYDSIKVAQGAESLDTHGKKGLPG